MRPFRRALPFLALFAAACEQAPDPAAPPLEAGPTLTPVADHNEGTAEVAGPWTFTRQRGQPVTEAVGFVIDDYAEFDQPMRLVMRNGDGSGNNVVTSGRVWLDGVLVLAPADFDKNAHEVIVDITPAASGTFEVRLASKPGSTITLHIEADYLPLTFPSLRAHWLLDEAAGATIAVDATGRGNDGSVAEPGVAFGAPGVHGSSLEYGPTDGLLSVPVSNDVNFATEDFSITLWFKSTAGGDAAFFNTRNTTSCGAASGPTVTGSLDAGRARFSLRGDDGAKHALFSPAGINDGLWHHFVAVRDGDTARLYVDGVLVESEAVGALTDFTTTRDFWMGKTHYCAGSPYVGNLDDVRIYDGALNEDHVHSLFAGP